MANALMKKAAEKLEGLQKRHSGQLARAKEQTHKAITLACIPLGAVAAGATDAYVDEPTVGKDTTLEGGDLTKSAIAGGVIAAASLLSGNRKYGAPGAAFGLGMVSPWAYRKGFNAMKKHKEKAED